MYSQASAIATTNDPTIKNLDWSQHLVDSTLTRYPDARQFGSWAYPRGLYLFAQYLVYKRTGDRHYLKYIEEWVDAHLEAEGHPDHQVHALDDVLAANLLVVLYQETHQPRYKVAAESFRHDVLPKISRAAASLSASCTTWWQILLAIRILRRGSGTK